MRAVVFSDTHSNTALMVEAVKRFRPDLLIHLGDYVRDTTVLKYEFPEIPLYSVRGNCDIGVDAPDIDIVQMGQVKVFITHGHLYNVKYDHSYTLAYAAQERGASIALFGHTHEPLNEELGSLRLINPGSAGKGSKPTCAIIEVFDNGGIASEIREI